MAWTAVATVVTGDIITAAWGNTYVRDNTQYLYDAKLSLAGGTMTGALTVLEDSALADTGTTAASRRLVHLTASLGL